MAHDLTREFNRRGPWVTKFVIDNQEYGGRYEAADDTRLKWFRQHFPHARTILELGSLEGGHSFALAVLPDVERIVAVEGRRKNLRRAKFVQELLHLGKVEFVRADLETVDLTRLGSFDVVLCMGVLYHLREPWRLLGNMRRAAGGAFIWTHYAEDSRARVTRHGYKGRLYREWFFLWEPLSGLRPASFWPRRPDLLRMLADAGFVDASVVDDRPDHEHGPAITISVR